MYINTIGGHIESMNQLIQIKFGMLMTFGRNLVSYLYN